MISPPPRRAVAWIALSALIVSAAPIRLQAQPPAGTPSLAIAGDVGKPLSLSIGDLKSMPRKKVEVKGTDATLTVYEGVLVAEILKAAGVPLGGPMGGSSIASYALASAPDGYQALFAMAELDPALAASDILVADLVDGKPLADGPGPLRLIVPKDLGGARSVRMLYRIDVVRLRK